jgi:hypothetical protein
LTRLTAFLFIPPLQERDKQDAFSQCFCAARFAHFDSCSSVLQAYQTGV